MNMRAISVAKEFRDFIITMCMVSLGSVGGHDDDLVRDTILVFTTRW